MVSVREFSVAVYGAWRFATLDRTAAQFFENTPGAFWKSFNAAIFVAPGYVLLTLLGFIERPVEASELRIVCVEAIYYVISWVLFPLVMLSFTEAAGCPRLYFRFIGAWNWSAVLQVYFILGVTAFISSGALPSDAGTLIALIASLMTLVYQGFIAHATLGIAWLVTALVVGIDLFLGIALELVSRVLY
jgi:hypothetical protein